jgi:Na+-transporting NADH:ubiquinone oxidoreductase subunit C
LKDNKYTIGFAGVLSAVCALLLTGAATVTAPFRENNARIEEVLNILSALNVPLEEGESAARLLEKFEQNVREEKRGDITFYVYSSCETPSQPKALAVRFVGSGVWGPIEGFLAMEPDMKTIRAIAFAHQEETPGLGGEISASWFRQQFVGKSIRDAAGQVGIIIGKTEAGPNAVNAITGATMTSGKLEAILNDTIKKFVEETNEQR